MRDAVRGACELLGLDPLHIANEGQFLAVVAPECADARAGGAASARPAARRRRIIGEVREQPAGTVLATTRYGGTPHRGHAGGRSAAADLLGDAHGDRRPRCRRTSRSGCCDAQRALRARSSRAKRCAWREACREMSERFLRGGRLLAFGRGPYATDAQHVSVEFVHPVIVGKRALPALDLSLAFGPLARRRSLQPEDIVMGFGPPEAIREWRRRSTRRAARGAMTFALPGRARVPTPSMRRPRDPFVHQEMIEILYHTLWETVHVFFEHRELGHDVGDAGFLYPFLGREKQDTPTSSTRWPRPSG